MKLFPQEGVQYTYVAQVKTKDWASWFVDQLLDSSARLGYEKLVKLRLITVHYGRHAPGKEKSETRREFLVEIIDEKDVFTDANI